MPSRSLAGERQRENVRLRVPAGRLRRDILRLALRCKRRMVEHIGNSILPSLYFASRCFPISWLLDVRSHFLFFVLRIVRKKHTPNWPKYKGDNVA
jgi:hypothetical protein